MSKINDIKMCKTKILSTPVDQITKTFIEEMFAAYHDKETNTFHPANFETNDPIILTSKEYKWVKGEIETTLGLLIFNRFILEKNGIIEKTGYWNRTIDSKGLNNFDQSVTNLVITDQISTQTLGKYVDSRDKLGFWSAAFLSASVSEGLIMPQENVNKRKEELFKEKAEDINSNDPIRQIMAVNTIEKELIGMVKDNLKDDVGYDLYASGVNNLPNNYKTINVMRGAVYNNSTKRYDVVKNSLMNGIEKKDITAFANSVVAGAYPSAVGTAEAGYMAKIVLALLQSEHIDTNPDSDCGTTATIPLTITDNNKQHVLFRYINDNGKRVLITLDNVSKYIGKTVQLYSPQGCKHDSICGKCAGKLFHNLGELTNVGLLLTQITQKLLNFKLKSKHDLSQSAGIIPESYVFLDQNKYCDIIDGVLKNKVTMKLFIPRILEDISGFVRELTYISCFSIFPVKFYDNSGNVLLSTIMAIPATLDFNIYSEIQEDKDYYIISYEPNSEVCKLMIQKSYVNAEFYINQIYLHSTVAQIPYNLMTEMMFRACEINETDLTGPSITYEFLARRVCRAGTKSFAHIYANNPKCDQMSYEKKNFRTLVQEAGALQGVLFQSLTESMNKGLAMTLNGIEATPTPFEKIIKA